MELLAEQDTPSKLQVLSSKEEHFHNECLLPVAVFGTSLSPPCLDVREIDVAV
jgi:hypothetical protein